MRFENDSLWKDSLQLLVSVSGCQCYHMVTEGRKRHAGIGLRINVRHCSVVVIDSKYC